mgnify:FL=1
MEDPNLNEVLDGFENDVTYEKTGNEGSGVNVIKNTASAKDKSYDQGGFSTQQPSTGTLMDIKEKYYVLTKSAILEHLNQH